MTNMHVLLPLSACASELKSDRFLGLLKDIADVTFESEHRCLAYAWFQGNAEANKDTIPTHWVRGLEVYEDESALAIDHRSSDPYKKMRKAVGDEEILSQPTDLRFLQPTGIGFLAREGEHYILQNDCSDAQEIVLIKEYSPPSSEAKQKLLDSLRSAAGHDDINAKRHEILTFWVLEYKPNYEDHGVKVVVRIADKAAQALFESSQAVMAVNSMLTTISTLERVTEWVASGIGFIAR